METTIEQLRTRARQGDAQSQLQLGQVCFSQGEYERMAYWLREAANSGLVDAVDAWAYSQEKGLGVERDPERALDGYQSAAAKGSAQASYRAAELLYKSRSAASRADDIQGHLAAALAGNYPLAARAAGFLCMQSAATTALARSYLERAAALGDPVSQFNLGWWLLEHGDQGEDMAHARFWLLHARRAAYPFADELAQGCPARRPRHAPGEPASAPEALPEQVSLFPSSEGLATPSVLSTEPAIKTVGDVLDLPSRAYLIYTARPLMHRAEVIDPDSEGGSMSSDVRTNASTFLRFAQVDFLAHYAERKVALAAGREIARSEPASVLWYQRGQYYKPHYDFFEPELTVSRRLLEQGGQRTLSAITYLSEPRAGGGTGFPQLDLEVPATAGTMLMFENCTEDGAPERRSEHAGLPVEQGTKWVFTKWFRQEETGYLELS